MGNDEEIVSLRKRVHDLENTLLAFELLFGKGGSRFKRLERTVRNMGTKEEMEQAVTRAFQRTRKQRATWSEKTFYLIVGVLSAADIILRMTGHKG